MTIQDKLEKLAEMQSHQDVIRLHYADLKATIIPPEIKAQLDEIDAEAQTALDALSGGIDSLTAEIKAEVITAGTTVKSEHLQAVYAKGRVSWDNKGLDGYMVAHPEIGAFRKTGEPSVSIRRNS